MAQISLRLDEKLRVQLAAWGRLKGCSVNQMIVRILEKTIETGLVELAGEYEAARAEYLRVSAALTKVSMKRPGEKLTLADFAENEAGRDFIDELMNLSDEYTEEEIARYKNGVSRGDIADFFNIAELQFDRLTTAMEMLDAPLSTEIDDMFVVIAGETEPRISTSGRERIVTAAEKAGIYVANIGGNFGIEDSIRWTNTLNGHNLVSNRAMTLIRQWVRRVEEDAAERKASRPALRLVKG